MKLIVPIAGRGSRFSNQKISIPKPLIPVCGKPMISWALKSVSTIHFSEIIFICLSIHEIKYQISQQLSKIINLPYKIIFLDDVTHGQLCTTLTARNFIDCEEDILIASSDTYVVSNLKNDIHQKRFDTKGIISVAEMPGDSWSFARIDQSGGVIEVAEKVRISNFASTGLYYFSSGHDFIKAADEIVRTKGKMKGEYYIISVYKKYIEQGCRIDISRANEMWDMGTPDSLKKFEEHIYCNEGI
jgi:UDP-N-acetylglucosamine diphosphorylase / glucose-1-phosphate thymidylyltransferase / UDP-N-acetylgalactosamine diphosphorylase / glucosamine-1-phosphate N-acetyltransferase / galactosamine-1-phosphate N-acetyltransferase